MIQDHIRLVQDSWSQLKESGVNIGPGFYERLFARAPEARPMFKTDLKSQALKFELMMDFIVDGLSDLKASLPKLEALGRAHREFGTLAAHYSVLTEALVDTLSATIGEKFTPTLESAWRDLLAMICRVMIDSSAYGNWSVSGDDKSNPLTPIVGITVQRYAGLVSAFSDLEPHEITDERLTEAGIDRQTWDTARSGWNVRLTHPTYGGVVASEYMAAYRQAAEKSQKVAG